MSTVTIGFVPRERFSLAAESLQRIFDYTDIPFNLIVVDCNIPTAYRERMEKVLKGRSNVKVIHKDYYLLPNQARNLVIREAKDDFLCLIENDNLVEKGWLSKLIAACEEHPADVAIPLLIEGRPGSGKVHFDDALGSVHPIETETGTKLEIHHRSIAKELSVGANRRTEEFMETHCILFRREVFDHIDLMDEEINTSEEVDLSLALYHANVPAVFEPKCVIHYVLPSFPLPAGDREYFLMKWNVENAEKSHVKIQTKWNLAQFPQVPGFVVERNLRGSGASQELKQELMTFISPEKPFILVDQEQWKGDEIFQAVFEDLKTIPFCEKDGQYWGMPSDADTAIQELERLRQTGATHIIFAWHCFWLLDHYVEFDRYLRSTFPCVFDNKLIVAFSLQSA